MFTFKITPDGGGEAITFKSVSRDVLAWEKATRGSLSGLLANRKMADLYRIAHYAGRRTGMVTVDLPEFEKSFDLDVIDDEDEIEADPTQPAP